MNELVATNAGALYQPAALGADLFQRYVAYVDRRQTTTEGYLTCLKQFARWMQATGTTHPQRDDILAYKKYLDGTTFGRSGQEPLKAGTKRQYIRAVKGFFRWTAAEGLYPNIADNIHTETISTDPKKDALAREDVAPIAASVDRSTEAGKRLYAMIVLGATCGLRVVEMSRANLEDIKSVGQRVYLYLWGKGHSEPDQPVLLPAEVQEALKDYISSRTDHHTGKSPLFVSTSNRSKGKRLAPTTISTMIKGALVDAGYNSDRLTAHSLRHTSGTAAYKVTGNIYLAQKHQRHVDPSTTEVYVHAEERSERNTEELVYNYLFKPDAGPDERQEAISLINTLNPAKLHQVCEFIRAIK